MVYSDEPKGWRVTVTEESPGHLAAVGFYLSNVVVTNPTSRESANCYGLIDTGATFSHVNTSIAKKLRLEQSGEQKNNQVDGKSSDPKYACTIGYGNDPHRLVLKGEFCSWREGDHQINGENALLVLLGRDFLSKTNFVWNGPAGTVTLKYRA